MSFLKITDPAKRDHIVQEFLKTRANIQQDLLTERWRLGDIGLQRELTKWSKPITDVGKSQLAQQQVLSSTLQERPSIMFPRYPSIQAITDDDKPEESLITLGPTAMHYLRSMAGKVPTDKTFGLRDEDGKFYIGDSEVTIANDDIVINSETWHGTPGLWELITSKVPDDKIYTDADHENYKRILLATNAIINPATGKVKSSSGEKYNTIIKPIYEEHYKRKTTSPELLLPRRPPPTSPALRRIPATATLLPPKTGRGTVVIPQDPNALVELLELRVAGCEAGNTGVTNEIVAICDKLLRQGELDKDGYKKLMSRINKSHE